MLLEYIFFAFIQGIFEFIPISSSAHLILLGVDNLLIITTAHLGSLFAVMIYFSATIKEYITSLIYNRKKKIILNLNVIQFSIVSFLALIPLLLIVVFETDFIFSKTTIVSLLFLNGLLLLSAHIFHKCKYNEEITKTKAFIIGFGQFFALLPGLSRSGMVIFSSVIQKISTKDAVIFSLLLSIPTLFFAWVYSIYSIDNINLLNRELILIFLVSFLSSLFSITLIIKVVKKMGLLPFAIYCLLTPIFIIF